MLHLSLERVGACTTIFCAGRMVLGQEDMLLKTIFVMRGCNHLTLDLSSVVAIDARGLGTLAAAAKWAIHEDVQLAIFNPSSHVHDLIRMVKLDDIISVVFSKDESLGCFTGQEFTNMVG
jgi:anti-anti-sigma factor